MKKAYEVLSDKKKKEEYDDSLLSDDQYYRLFGLDMRYIFVFTLMLMSMKSIRDSQESKGKCPINHQQREISKELEHTAKKEI